MLKKTIVIAFVVLILGLNAYAILPRASAINETPGQCMSVALTPNIGSIAPKVTDIGRIALSIDGQGCYPGNTGTIQVQKPAGATVRSAYMAAATIWSGGRILTGDVKVDGTDVAWSVEIPNVLSSYNYWTEVTSIVKPKIDAVPAGRVDFTITENPSKTGVIDGEILAVIFDDPSQPTDNTVVLLFGSQAMSGDTFAIGLSEPIDKSDPNLKLDMSLGITYSYQIGAAQYSIVEVNGQRLTTWAGGEDDGGSNNGRLITVGGLDDNNTNPANPYLSPVGNYRYDDELYNIVPFVQDGDTSISVFTRNPSNDDNVMFAALFMSTAAVVGEGIVIAPVSATNPVNTQHTVTATVQDSLGNPIVGRDVKFEVKSGPNSGTEHTEATDLNGHANFAYIGATAGVDVIQASFVNNQNITVYSNEATKTWLAVTIESCDSNGVKKDTFNLNHAIYANGTGYGPSTEYDIYVVDDTTWINGMDIPARILGTATTVMSDASGIIVPTVLWNASLTPGKYDILVDFNGNGKYDEGIDALDNNDVVATAGFLVIPEFWLGAIAGPIGCFAALGIFRIIKIRKH